MKWNATTNAACDSLSNGPDFSPFSFLLFRTRLYASDESFEPPSFPDRRHNWTLALCPAGGSVTRHGFAPKQLVHTPCSPTTFITHYIYHIIFTHHICHTSDWSFLHTIILSYFYFHIHIHFSYYEFPFPTLKIASF